MSTETFLSPILAAGLNMYGVVHRASDGLVLDNADQTFRALGSATTPEITATEVTTAGGTGQSQYRLTIDLADVNATPTPTSYTLQWYDNGTPAPTTDTVLALLDLDCELAELGRGLIVCRADVGFDGTSGANAYCRVWLERDGRVVDVDTLDAACSATLDVRESESGADLFNLAFTAADLQGDVFEKSQASPGFTSFRLYEYDATVTINSVSINGHTAGKTVG